MNILLKRTLAAHILDPPSAFPFHELESVVMTQHLSGMPGELSVTL